MTPKQGIFSETLSAMQSWSYEDKVTHAEDRALNFFKHENGKVYVGLGGLESLTLLIFLRKYIDPNIPGATISVIEDKSIQEVHRSLDNIIFLKPLKSKVQILNEYGYPIVSKEKARKISHLQSPENPKQTYIHAIMTGDMGEQGNNQHSDRIKLPDKWIRLFGGHYAGHRPDLTCQTAPFKVSPECCRWLKERPSEIFQKETGLHPYLGLMISEGGQRKWGLMKHGCNYYGKTTIRSCPFAIFTKSDLLRLALDLNVPIPKVYGEVIQLPDGSYKTTRAQRTGCSMCGFGVHLEHRPHRFDILREDNLKEWEFWMLKMGWGKVLSYIGVKWE
jgi:hypothetical protein